MKMQVRDEIINAAKWQELDDLYSQEKMMDFDTCDWT